MHPFDQQVAASVAESEPWVFDTCISSHWSINDVPNGGYLLALLANGMLRRSTKKALVIATATFISRSVPGQARIAMEPIGASTQFERFEAKLLQGDRERIRALGTFMDENRDCTVSRHEAAAPEIAPLDQCVAIPRMPKFTLFDQMDVRLDPASADWMAGRSGDRSEMKGWVRFRDARPYDALAIVLMADTFPPPAYITMGLGAWVPTIEFSVNIRRMPASQWLKCIFRTRFITCGMLEEDGQLWDEEGALVAVSRQIAQYRASA